MSETTASDLLPIAVLVSGTGRGSNLGALIEGCATGEIAGKVAVVIGTRSEAPALLRAQAAGIATSVVSPRKYEGDEAGYEAVVQRILARHRIGLLCLSGYMRRLPPGVVADFRGRIMNIHPALLPLFGGKGMYGEHVHRAVLESGMKVAGCTVHFVDEEYDTGPIIVQSTVPVLDNDTPETLAGRVLKAEHRAYVQAVSHFAAGRLRIEGQRVYGASPGPETAP